LNAVGIGYYKLPIIIYFVIYISYLLRGVFSALGVRRVKREERVAEIRKERTTYRNTAIRGTEWGIGMRYGKDA
jgi:hypothetical protein